MPRTFSLLPFAFILQEGRVPIQSHLDVRRDQGASGTEKPGRFLTGAAWIIRPGVAGRIRVHAALIVAQGADVEGAGDVVMEGTLLVIEGHNDVTDKESQDADNLGDGAAEGPA